MSCRLAHLTSRSVSSNIVVNPPKLTLTPSVSKTIVPQEIHIPVPWGHIAGKWWGSLEAQPVLLLHGWQDNAGSFDRLIPHLKNEAFFAIDMVGHGLSSHYPPGQGYYNVDALINLRRIIKHFKWKNVSLIGHSMGSTLGFVYAGCFPEDVNKLVSLEGVRAVLAIDRRDAGKDLRHVVDGNLHLEKKLGQTVPWYHHDKIIEVYLKGVHNTTSKDMIAPILERGLLKSSDGYFYSFARDPRVKLLAWFNVSPELVEAASSNITCDILDIRAKDGYTIGEKKHRLHLKTLSILKNTALRVTHHDVEGTHYVHLNNPQLVAPLINQFFEKTVLELAIC